MRCPKCGYISYDHLEDCLKCKKNIKTVSDALQGSVFNVAPPLFLQLQADQSLESSSDDKDLFGDDESSEEFVDEDLEVLIDGDVEEGDEIDFEDEDQITVLEDEDVSLDDSADDDEREFELDFSQLEDAPEPEITQFDEPKETEEPEEQAGKEDFTIELPDELADISDLAPPESIVVSEEDAAAQQSGEKDVAGFDLGELDFELGVDETSGGAAVDTKEEDDTMLSLDDIDFSETLTESTPKPSSKSSDMGMDEELNFDLDLGGLSIHEDV